MLRAAVAVAKTVMMNNIDESIEEAMRNMESSGLYVIENGHVKLHNNNVRKIFEALYKKGYDEGYYDDR